MFKKYFLWIFSISLFVIHFIIITSYNILCYIYGSNNNLSETLPNKVLWFLILIAFVLIFINAINRNENWKRGLKICHISLTVLMVFTLNILLMDSPPIENDYNFNDIISEHPAAINSYGTLKMLLKNTDDSVTVAAPRLEFTNRSEKYYKHAGLINKSWQDISTIRAIIEKLDSYL